MWDVHRSYVPHGVSLHAREAMQNVQSCAVQVCGSGVFFVARNVNRAANPPICCFL